MIGKILGGRYELLEKIGHGGMAVVYKARCKLLNRIVAVKILRTDLEGGDEFLKRFNVEAQSAASLTHPNIVSIFDVGNEEDIHYIVMEYVEGVTLKDYIRTNSPIPWKNGVKITLEIARALEEAHKKHIIHRDIKPQNIIATNDGGIKVTDFGIARAASAATLSVDNDVLGSVHYFSPEQARGGYVDEKSDIYSLGIVMYEMLTGQVPFDGDTPVAIAMKQIEQPPVHPAQINPEIPESIASIALKAISKETRNRYQSITEMEEDLSKALDDPASVVVSVAPPVEENLEETRKMEPLRKKEIIIDIPGGDVPVKKTSGKKMTKDDKRALVAALVTSLLIVGILSFFVVRLIYPDFSPFAFMQSKEVEVPSLLGFTLQEAEEELDGTRLVVKVIDEIQDPTAEPGTILAQDPKEGMMVKGKQTIEVVVAKGLATFRLDDYVNKPYRDVESALRGLGLQVEVEYVQSETVALDYVIRHNPSGGTKVSSGETIILYVSQGPDPQYETVPNLLELSLAQAKDRLEQVNLVVGNITYDNSTKPKDTVIGQSISGGDPVAPKTPVNLVVSKGPDASTAEQVSKTLTVNLPDKDSVDLKIVANNKTVYQGKHNPKAENHEFSTRVKGTGKINFDIYFDGTLAGSKTIDFSK